MNTLLFKEFVKSFSWTDLNDDRYGNDEVMIDGRQYIKCGVCTATACVGNLYVDESNVESLKYVLLIGVARQKETGFDAKEEAAIELAAINAQTNPQVMFRFDHEIGVEEFENICWMIVNMNKRKFILTEEEFEKCNSDK